MSIKHCIIHSISRKNSSEKVSIETRTDENPSEGPIVSLFTQLKSSLQRSATRQYGQFDPELSDNPLPGWLTKLENEEMGFISLSQKITEQLQLVLADTEEPISAHLLFVVEELMEHQYLYIFWVNHSDAQTINSHLEAEDLTFIDGNKIHYVMKLDFSQWEIKDWQQYLTLQTSRGSREIAHSFTRFTGFISGVNLQQQTDEFLNIVDQYTQTLDSEQSNPTKNAIVNYCVDQDMQGNPINFEALSQTLDENTPDKFSQFVGEKQETPQKAIYAHRSSLKKYVRFYGREKDLSISFSSDRMDDNIIYDADSGALTFKQVPKSLQAQLAKYLRKQSSSQQEE